MALTTYEIRVVGHMPAELVPARRDWILEHESPGWKLPRRRQTRVGLKINALPYMRNAGRGDRPEPAAFASIPGDTDAEGDPGTALRCAGSCPRRGQ
jgi:hypothetical protein